MAEKRFATDIDFAADPITFVLEGERTSEPHEHWEERFTILPAIPHGAIDAVMRMQVVDERGRIGANVTVITAFMRSVLTDADQSRFDQLIADRDRIVSTEAIAETAAWVVKDVSQRPTRRLPASAVGQPSAGNGSTPSLPAPTLMSPG